MLGRAEGEEELGLAVEEERGEAGLLASVDEVREIDVRREVLLAGVGQQIARDALARVRGGGPVAAQARAEEGLLRVAVVEGDDEAARNGAADLVVERGPAQGDVGELTV